MPKLTRVVWQAIGDKILGWKRFKKTAPGRLFRYLADKTIEEAEFAERDRGDVEQAYAEYCVKEAADQARKTGLDQTDLDRHVGTVTKGRIKKERLTDKVLDRLQIDDRARDYVKAVIAPPHFSNLETQIRRHLRAFNDTSSTEEFKLAIQPGEFVVTVLEAESAPPPPPPPLSQSNEPWPTVPKEGTTDLVLSEFRDFIVQQSEAQGTTDQERNSAIALWALDHWRKRLKTVEEFFQCAEARGEVSFSEMRSIADAIDVHAIMLDPLLSCPVDRDLLVLRLPTATTPVDPDGYYFGTPPPYEAPGASTRYVGIYGTKGARYAIPNAKLRGTESAFVFLRLGKGDSSAQHHHAGDELLLVIDGTVSVSFMDSGLTFELQKHSYVHFYSEQNHSVTNTSDQVAQLFIVRFYQFHRHRDNVRTRQQMRGELWEKLRKGPFVKRRELEELTWGWILNVTADQSSTPREPAEDPHKHIQRQDQLLNRFGLARFLRQTLAHRQLSRKQEKRLLKLAGAAENSLISDHATRIPYEHIEEWLWHLESNQVKVPKSLIPEIIEVCNVFDLLACEFLFPSVPRQVVVRRGDDKSPGDWVDMTSILETVPDLLKAGDEINKGAYRLKQSKGGFHYEIPTRSLACSDVAISWLRLESKEHQTSANQHAGCELLIPVEGRVAILYEDGEDAEEVVVASEQIAHYDSTRLHRIKNAGDGPAVMFVIRFYLDAKQNY